MNPYFKEGEHLFRPANEALRKDGYWPRERFTAIDPGGSKVFLRFKPNHKNEIETIFNSLDAGLDMYLKLDQHHDRILLNNDSDRVYADVHPKVLMGVLQKLGSYVSDVRFLMFQEQSFYTDEVIIQNGLLYVYRHELDDDFMETRLEYFETILNSYPEDDMLRSWLCLEYQNNILQRIDYDYLGDATEYLDKAIRLSTPEDPWMPYVLGKIALKKEDFQTALTYFREAATKSSKNFEIHYESGRLLVLQFNEYSEGIEHLSSALQLKPYTDIYSWRALAFLQLNKTSEAEADINSYTDKIKPHNNSSFITAARLLSEAGFKTWGDKLLHAGLEKNQLYENELIERKEKDKDPNKAWYDTQLNDNTKTRSSLYSSLGINAASLKDRYDYTSKALSLAETDPNLLYNMGVVLYDQGKMAEAEQYYDRTLALKGNFIKALNNKSIIRMQKGDYPTALSLTDQLLQIDNTYAEAFSTKATIAYYTGDLASALKYYEEYLTHNPSSGKGQYGVGFIYTHMRQDEKAIPYLQQAIELSGNNPQQNEMYSNLANCYNNIGQLTAGIEAAERSITVNPNYYHPYYILACIYKKEDRDDEALEMVKKALQIAPSQRNQIINEPDLIGLKEKMQSL